MEEKVQGVVRFDGAIKGKEVRPTFPRFTRPLRLTRFGRE